jgi:hypothetical protein
MTYKKKLKKVAVKEPCNLIPGGLSQLDCCLEGELTRLLPMLYRVDVEKFENYVEDRTLAVGTKIKLRFLDYERERELSHLSYDWDNNDCNPQHFAFLYDPKKMFKYTLY